VIFDEYISLLLLLLFNSHQEMVHHRDVVTVEG